MKLILAILFAAFAASAQVPQQVVNDWMLMAAPQSAAWSPTQITGLVRWYDAQSIVGLNNGDSVSSWTDKAGITNLTQAEASKRPIYVSSDSIFGNKAAIKFDSTDDILTNATPEDASCTVFVVGYRTNVSSVGVFVSFASSTSARIYNALDNYWKYATPTKTNSVSCLNQSGVEVVRFNSLSSADTRCQSGSWSNFDPNDAYAAGGAPFCVGGIPGSSYWLGGFVGEIILYNSSLSDENINLVGRYLAGRWNFTWTDL